MNVYIAGDHAGFQLKSELIPFLKSLSNEVTDLGPFTDARCDYPDFAHSLANNVFGNVSSLGILICGSANGVCITANKHKGIRAAIAWEPELASLARQHNNANVICLPARFISLEKAKEIVTAFLNSSFEGGRHEERVRKIEDEG